MWKCKIVCVSAVALIFSLVDSVDGAERNVILYVVDDQGLNDAGCYGNSIIRTPGLDMLAAHGTRMNFAYATTPSCSASRSAILTGRHNHDNRQFGHMHSYHHFATREDIRSLPVRMGDAGYRTLSAGKFHVAPKEVYRFDAYQPVEAPVEMANRVESFIDASSEKPFFLYFCTTEPHRPFRREGMAPVAPEDVIVPDYLPDTPACRAELAEYYMSVERADSGLVRLIEILRETGHWEDTLILYLSDNGIAFPGAKTTVYEPGVRLPCVIRDPSQKVLGGTSDAMFTYTSIAPTILDFAGVPYGPGEFQGPSLAPTLANSAVDGYDEVFLSHTFHEITMYYPMRVVRDRRYKLIWNMAHGLPFPFASDLYASRTWQGILREGAQTYGKRSVQAYLHRPPFELYDLKNDPHEVRNLADDPDAVGILQSMQERLKQHQLQTNDPWIVKWEHE